MENLEQGVVIILFLLAIFTGIAVSFTLSRLFWYIGSWFALKNYNYKKTVIEKLKK